MTYYKDGKEFTLREVKAIHKNVSFREPTQLGYSVILPTPKPECGELQQAIHNGVETDSKGNLVRAWKIVDMFTDYTNEDGVVVTKAEQEQAYLTKKQEEATKQTVTNVTNAIDNFIQSKIDAYNDANGTLFKDINSISKYLVDTTYSHYTFCEAIIKWNIQVWETARQIQADVLAGTRTLPTDITLELPELVY